MNEIKKGVILAAGFGTRLKPITHTIPKPLLALFGIPVIEYAIRNLKKGGIKKIIINTHHLGEKIIKKIGDGKKYGVKIKYSFEKEILGTGGALVKMKNELKNEHFIIHNSDVITLFDIKKIIEYHLEKKSFATMVLTDSSFINPEEKILVDKNGVVRGITPYCESHKSLKKYTFTGIHILSEEIFNFLPAQEVHFNIIDAYISAIKKDIKINSIVLSSFWMDIGTWKQYIKCKDEILKNFKEFKKFYRIKLKKNNYER